MPDEATEAPEKTQDTPVEQEAAPETGTPEQAIDYEQRYNDLRPEFDRTTQEREQAKQEVLAWQLLASSDDEDQREAAAEFLGVELSQNDEEEEGDVEDPYEQRLSQIEQAQLAQQEADSQKAFDSHLDELAGGSEVELNKNDRRTLQAISEDNGFSPEATEEAFKQFVEERKAYEKSVIDGYVKGKRNAPRVPSAGSNANEIPDLDDRQKRVAHMTEQYLMGRQ